MKKIVIMGKNKCPVSAYSENYLKKASCPVYVDDKPHSVTFEWDDTLKEPDGTPIEHLCPRPVDRIMDTITEIIIVDDQDGLKKRITDMKSGETLGYDSDTGEFRCDYCLDNSSPDNRERWRVIDKKTDVVSAFRKVMLAAETGIKMAACLGDRFITAEDIGKENDNCLTAEEVLSRKWEVLELTDDIKKSEEKFRTMHIRNLLKKTNYFGIKHDVIDNMSLDDIWEKMCGHRFSDEKKYDILKYILEK